MDATVAITITCNRNVLHAGLKLPRSLSDTLRHIVNCFPARVGDGVADWEDQNTHTTHAHVRASVQILYKYSHARCELTDSVHAVACVIIVVAAGHPSAEAARRARATCL